MEIGRRVGGGQIPFGLGESAGGAQRQDKGSDRKQASLHGDGLQKQAI